MLTSCVTTHSRPTLLDLPAGPPLVEPVALVDDDPDASVVDVRLAGPQQVIMLGAADALVIRIPPTSSPQTLVVDELQASITTSPAAESVWLLGPQRSGVYAIRRGGELGRLDAVVVVQARERRERVLLLNDTTAGIERIEGLGNVVTVNGQRRPTLSVVPGAKERWHFANTSVARSFVLILPGHVFAVVGGSAVGEIALVPGAVVSADVELGNEAIAAFDLVTLDGSPVSGEAWPLIHVVTNAAVATKEKS